MQEIELRSSQKPGLISIDNFEELRGELTAYLARYQDLAYTPESLSEAKADMQELGHLRRQLEKGRKEVRRRYIAPYNAFESRVGELIGLINGPLKKIKRFIAQAEMRERAEKRKVILDYCRKHGQALGGMAEQVFASPAFVEEKWFSQQNAWKVAAKKKIAKVAQDLATIQASGGAESGALTVHYLRELNTRGLRKLRKSLNTVEAVKEPPIPPKPEDLRVGYKVIKLTGTVSQLNQALKQLELAGTQWEEVEDGTPQPLRERLSPDFDSFVAVDTESSGSFGPESGDKEAEIMELSAVKVVNGVVVDRFSELLDPGRKITSQAIRVTGITKEMLKGKPKIEEVLPDFAAFIRGFILVGHDILSSDLYHIDRAARRCGITLEHEYFDTYRYALTLQQQQGWEKLSLEYLSDLFGVEHAAPHRAWCDAEANAQVYLKLRELSPDGGSPA